MRELKDPKEEWLQTYTKERSRQMTRDRFEIFLEWTGKTPQELLDEFDNKEVKKLILKFQNYLLNEKKMERSDRIGVSGSTNKATIGAVRAFYSFHKEPIRGLKGKIVGTGGAGRRRRYHAFSTTDLKKMYHIADTRAKAILSVGCSLGWEVSEIQKMKRDFYQKLVERARQENLTFIDFWTQRPKENVPRLGILNPLALDSLERWLDKTKDSKSKWLWANGGDKPITQETFNNILKSLAEEANIVLMGDVRFHALRGWLMSALSEGGMGEWEVKIVVGKSIPSSDSVYLNNLRNTVVKKYEQIYPKYLSLVAYSNGQTKIESIEQAIDVFAKVLKEFAKRENIDINGLALTTNELNILKMRMGIKPKKKPKIEG
jgi:site-specific recombinase XerD